MHICTVCDYLWTFNTALKILLYTFLAVSLSYFLGKLFYTLSFFSPSTLLIHLHLSILHSHVIHVGKEKIVY